MKTYHKESVQILTTLILATCSVQAFADSQNTRLTEAGIQEDCNCSLNSNTRKGKQNYLEIAQSIDASLQPIWYDKYHVKDFLLDQAAKQTAHQQEITDNLNKNFSNLNPEQKEKLIELEMTKNTTTGEFVVHVDKIVKVAGKNTSAIKKAAEKYNVTMKIKGNVDTQGAQIGQETSVTISSKNPSNTGAQSALTLSKCNKDERVLNLGSTAGCDFSEKTSFETKVLNGIMNGVSAGANVNSFSLKPEGNVFIRVQW
ncbi:MAG: hypothetical protein ACXVCN_06955 [Bdellovibrio sp.]